jgi:hypothetical protein
MKKTVAILMLFLVSVACSVAAHPVTAKPHFATDLAVSKTSNEVVIIAMPSMDMAYNYEASEVINYCYLATTEVGTETKVLFAENRTVTRRSNINLNKPLKTEKIYLLNCSIKQCISRSLIRSV